MFSVFLNPAFGEIVFQNGEFKQDTANSMVHVHYMLDTQGCKHTQYVILIAFLHYIG
jgi:hypothetical protein